MYVFFALLAGMLVILCISINGRLAIKVGLIQSGIINYFVGLLSSFIFMIITNRAWRFNLIHLDLSIPLYFYLGGMVGSVIMILNSMIINNLSAVFVTILVFIGQLFIGVFIDYMQRGILPVGKVIGGILILVGLFLYIKGDNKRENHNTGCLH